MKVFVINLKKCKEKLEHFKKYCPIKNFEVFTAFDGKNLESNESDIGKNLFNKFKNLNKGEKGCFVSHYLIWNIIQETCEDNENIIIFEDDTIFNKNFSKIMYKIDKYNYLPQDNYITYIGGRFKKQFVLDNKKFLKVNNIIKKHNTKYRWRIGRDLQRDRTTQGYIISKKGAQFLIEQLIFTLEKKKNILPIDHWIIHTLIDNNINIYNTDPLITYSKWKIKSDTKE